MNRTVLWLIAAAGFNLIVWGMAFIISLGHQVSYDQALLYCLIGTTSAIAAESVTRR